MALVPSLLPIEASSCFFPMEADELNLRCLKYLDFNSLCKIAVVSRRLRALSQDETLWKATAVRLGEKDNFKFIVFAYRAWAIDMFKTFNQALQVSFRTQDQIDNEIVDRLYLKYQRTQMRQKFPRIEEVAANRLEALSEEKRTVFGRAFIIQELIRFSIFIAELEQDVKRLPDDKLKNQMLDCIPKVPIPFPPPVLVELQQARSRLEKGQLPDRIKIPKIYSKE